jgi:hypothetical protein
MLRWVGLVLTLIGEYGAACVCFILHWLFEAD